MTYEIMLLVELTKPEEVEKREKEMEAEKHEGNR